MKFRVRTKGKDLPVEFRFGSTRDFQTLSKWKPKQERHNDPFVLDALEYRNLANKRWRTYSESQRTATSVRSLRTRHSQGPPVRSCFHPDCACPMACALANSRILLLPADVVPPHHPRFRRSTSKRNQACGRRGQRRWQRDALQPCGDRQ